MRVLVYEHVSGGGFAEDILDPSFAAQGFAMLFTIIRALKKEGHTVLVTRDSRLNAKLLPSDIECLEVVDSSSWSETLRSACEKADLGITIAPEDDFILEKVIAIMRSTGLNIIGPDPNVARLCSNKVLFNIFLAKKSFETPKTTWGTPYELINKADTIAYPAVIKPVASSGASRNRIIRSSEDIHILFDAQEAEQKQKQFVIQEYIPGIDASVSLMVCEDTIQVLSINRQYVSLGGPTKTSGYHGGECPIKHPSAEKAGIIAQEIAESIGSLQGYVGIDFVLQEKRALPIEINPRLTVSAVGVARVRGLSALANIVKCIEGSIPDPPNISGYSVFSESIRFNVPYTDASIRKCAEIAELEGVASPPIPLPNDRSPIMPYLAGFGASVYEARTDLLQIQDLVESNLGGL
jgi:predicted ATP-grasp superfamily ATP-dependent carboligase